MESRHNNVLFQRLNNFNDLPNLLFLDLHLPQGLHQGIAHQFPMLITQIEPRVRLLHGPAGVLLGAPGRLADELREHGDVEVHVCVVE